jgi:hypothetical protein
VEERPFAWQWKYSGHAEGCIVILESVASHDMWSWHSFFFGMAGSHNDINVLHRSSVLSRLVEGNAHVVSYEININAYNKPYYIVGGIYPDWIILVKIVCNLAIEKTKRFA